MADITRQEALNALKAWQTAYQDGSGNLFDLYDPSATLFTVSAPTRIDGVDEFRRGFEGSLNAGGAQRTNQVLSPDIHLSGPIAVVTYHQRVSISGRTQNLKGTAVLSKDAQGNVLIVHQHTSFQQAPSIPLGARTLDEINVLEERVASAAATIGTPK